MSLLRNFFAVSGKDNFGLRTKCGFSKKSSRTQLENYPYPMWHQILGLNSRNACNVDLIKSGSKVFMCFLGQCFHLIREAVVSYDSSGSGCGLVYACSRCTETACNVDLINSGSNFSCDSSGSGRGLLHACKDCTATATTRSWFNPTTLSQRHTCNVEPF